MIFSKFINHKKNEATNEPIIGFMHIGVLGNYEQILADQMQTLKDTDLLSATSVIFAGISGQKIELPPELKFAVHNPILEEGEVETIRYIHNMRKELVGSKIWYIHTKGAKWHPQDYNVLCAESWRKYMEHFVLFKWQNCVKTLDEYDVCGVEWDYIKNDPQQSLAPDEISMGRFSGNFWWARGDYLSKIKKPFPSVRPYSSIRHNAEFYLGRDNPKVFDFTSNLPIRCFHGNLYEKIIDRHQYINTKLI